MDWFAKEKIRQTLNRAIGRMYYNVAISWWGMGNTWNIMYDEGAVVEWPFRYRRVAYLQMDPTPTIFVRMVPTTLNTASSEDVLKIVEKLVETPEVLKEIGNIEIRKV